MAPVHPRVSPLNGQKTTRYELGRDPQRVRVVVPSLLCPGQGKLRQVNGGHDVVDGMIWPQRDVDPPLSALTLYWSTWQRDG